MKRFSLSLILGVSMLSVYAAEPELTFQGSGTETDPYLISTKADVLALADACGPGIVANAGHYAGVYFKLTADIDMENATGFYGIGSAPIGAASANTYYFAGNFDGQGHSIKNMEIYGVTFDDSGKAITKYGANQGRAFVGFFGTVKSGGIVRNLIIDSSCSVTGVKDCAGVVGYLGAGGTVENCANYASVTSYHQFAGGIAGEVVTTASGQLAVVRSSFNAGTVKANNMYAGGITANSSYATIEECANIGSVSATHFNSAATAMSQSRAGGISGSMTGATIVDCFNAGDVVADKESAGGIVGYGVVGGGKGAVLTCVNTGAVQSYYTDRMGNIVGYSGTSTTQALSNVASCYYDGQMLNQTFLANGAGACPAGSVKGMNTSVLTSGSILVGFSSRWKFKKGFYPVPAAISFDGLERAAGSYVMFPEGYDATHFIGTATLSSAVEGIAASVSDAPEGVFSIADGSVIATPGENVVLGKLTLSLGSFSRSLPVCAYEIPFEGEGTKENPYLISKKSDMMAFANISNEARNHWTSCYFKMTADIDMEGDKNFKGIAVGPDRYINQGALHRWYFDGVLDGDNHKISNLDINTVVFDDGIAGNFSTGSYHNTGLFGSLGAGAEIRNLILDKTSKITGYGLIGGIAGSLHRGPAVIDNCHVAATITAYNRYCGGLFGYSVDHAVKITNSSFTGTIHSNYDYVGGIAGWNGHVDAVISNCVNTGHILVERFNDCVPYNEKVSRVGGLSAVNSGTIEYSANYGPVEIDVPEAVAVIDGVGGICGQNTNSTGAGMASIHHNLNVGQVSVNGGVSTLNVGNILGWRYFAENKIQGLLAANYCDTTLNMQNMPVDSVPVSDTREAYIAMTTSQLTSGTPIEDLADWFSFEAGYYPIPKSFANVADVRAAAATFFILPAGESIRRIQAGTWAPFNTVSDLEPTLENENGFEIRKDGLQALGSDRTVFNRLTLRNGDYFNFYPLRKLAGNWQDGVETVLDEEIVKVEYFTPQGISLKAPVRNQVTIEVSTSVSGQKTVRKIIGK